MLPELFIDRSNNLFRFFILFYIVAIIGFFLNLDPNGGAYLDYLNQKRISEEFSINFHDKFLNFDKESTRHSPVLLIILSIFEKFKFPDIYIRLINYVHNDSVFKSNSDLL